MLNALVWGLTLWCRCMVGWFFGCLFYFGCDVCFVYLFCGFCVWFDCGLSVCLGVCDLVLVLLYCVVYLFNSVVSFLFVYMCCLLFLFVKV